MLNATESQHYATTTTAHVMDVNQTEEYLSAIIPWMIALHNLFWCFYFFYLFGCFENKFPAVSIGMKRSASLVFVTHAIAPFFMGFSNFYVPILFINALLNTSYPCRADFIIEILLYAFCKFALFLFFTFRVDVILRDSFFEYKRLQSWLLRLSGFIGFVALSIYLPTAVKGDLDGDRDFCLLRKESYLALYIGAAFNALMFLIVIIIFARKICQVTQTSSTNVREASIDYNKSLHGFEQLSYTTNVNKESFKLIETLQYHTLLITLNVCIELILLFVSQWTAISAICLALSMFVDIWCLLLMFRKVWFKKYCNYCLICSKPLWECCGVKLPQLYDRYDRNQSLRNRDYSAAKYNNDFENYFYDDNCNRSTQTELTNAVKPTLWDKLKRNKSATKKKQKYKSKEDELYQPLNEQ